MQHVETAKSNKEIGKTKGKTCFRSVTPRPATDPTLSVCVCVHTAEHMATIAGLPAPLPLLLLLSRGRARERNEACSDLYA